MKIGKLDLAENVTLEQAARKLGYMSPEDFDRWVKPEQTTQPGATRAAGG